MKHRTPPARISAVGFAAVNLENRHQILYRTNEFFGNVTTTVITVLVSYKVDRMIIISYQLAPSKNYAPSCTSSAYGGLRDGSY
ncbi:hypothetical protein TrVGV298_001477 [Trichoderma virens]|nr:hypothetical protein TrVGV298_001477 [Trichoderma virens]